MIITRGSEVLLVRRHNVHGTGTWSTPGGHVDFGESPEQCAAREALEETGVHIAEVRFRALTNDVFREQGRHYITLWFESRYVSGEAVVAAPDEISQIGWFPWASLPTPLFLCFENLLAGNCYPRPANPPLHRPASPAAERQR